MGCYIGTCHAADILRNTVSRDLQKFQESVHHGGGDFKVKIFKVFVLPKIS